MKKLTILISGATLLGGWQLAQAQPPGGGGGFTPPTFDALNTETEQSPDYLTQEEVMAFMRQRMAAFGGGGPGGPGGGPGAGGPGAGGPGGGGGPGGMFGRWDADGDGKVTRDEFDARPRGGPGGGPQGGPQQ